VRPGDPDAGAPCELVQAAGGGVAVHPGAAAVEQDRPAHAGSGRPVDGPADRWRQRDQDDLGALAAHTEDPVAVLLAEVGEVASKIRRPSRPSMATSAKSYGSGDSRAAVSSASNCRWVNPMWVIRQGRRGDGRARQGSAPEFRQGHRSGRTRWPNMSNSAQRKDIHIGDAHYWAMQGVTQSLGPERSQAYQRSQS
jgi:hypothetical protein